VSLCIGVGGQVTGREFFFEPLNGVLNGFPVEFSISLVWGFSYFSDGGVPKDSFTLELGLDSAGGDECVEECASEGVVFEYFGVFPLIFWFADEQPVDAVGGDTILGMCRPVV